MKNRLSVSVVLALVLVSSIMSAIAREDVLNAYMYVVCGPVRADAVTFDEWSTNAVWDLYSNQTLSEDVGYRLTADQITQSANLTDSNIWFVVRIVSKNSTDKFSLNMLHFSELSTDPDNTLANQYSPGSVTNLIYSRRAIGVIWSSGGPRASDTILSYQDGTNLVNEIDFIGMQSSYYQYPLATVSKYILGFTNFAVSAKCQVVDAAGAVLATVQRTVQRAGSPIQPKVIITDIGNSMVGIGVNMETNRTAIIMFTPQIQSPSWTTEATVNAGDEIIRNAAGGKTGFFRAVLQ